MSADAITYIDDAGHQVSVTYCAEGLCEQAVHTSPTWGADLIVHDRPRAAALH